MLDRCPRREQGTHCLFGVYPWVRFSHKLFIPKYLLCESLVIDSGYFGGVHECNQTNVLRMALLLTSVLLGMVRAPQGMHSVRYAFALLLLSTHQHYQQLTGCKLCSIVLRRGTGLPSGLSIPNSWEVR